MFSSILKRYNDLIDAMRNGICSRNILESARQIKTDWQKLQSDLQFQNESEIGILAKKRKCVVWNDILDNVEKQFRLLLRERLSMKILKIGVLDSEDGNRTAIEWTIRAIDPTLNGVHLLSNIPLAPCYFHKKGYTHIEDEDEFGCAEVACSWSKSDIRAFLNDEFYSNSFSDIEKAQIISQRRHYNLNDFLIPNDIAEDRIYLLKLDEFLMLPPEMQCCNSKQDNELWWLGEQKARGWDDTCELPRIYAVSCKTGALSEATPDKTLLPRIGMMVGLDYILSI